MQNRRRNGREIAGLLLLFGLFLAFAVYSERNAQETTSHVTPSSFNAKEAGVKALFLLLESQRLRVDRLRAPWSALTAETGLAIMIEPFDRDRPVREEELAALKRWVEKGGTAFYLVTDPPRPYDDKDTVFGDVAIEKGDAKAAVAEPKKSAIPYLQSVRRIAYASTVRLNPRPTSGYESLLEDGDGDLLIHKTLGKGHLIVGALGPIASNNAIQEADNAYLFYNIAYESAGRNGLGTLFDEYHHGVGFGEEGIADKGTLLQNTPPPLRWTFYYLLAFALLYVVNGNRRFGMARSLEVSPYRPSTDYVTAVARLFRKAHAPDLALSILAGDFRRDLARQFGLTPESPLAPLLAEAERRYPANYPALRETLLRCADLQQGKPILEAEMLAIARALDTLRRNCNLVG